MLSFPWWLRIVAGLVIELIRYSRQNDTEPQELSNLRQCLKKARKGDPDARVEAKKHVIKLFCITKEDID